MSIEEEFVADIIDGSAEIKKVLDTHFDADDFLSVSRGDVSKALEFYNKNYADFSLEDRIQAIREDISSGQIYTYTQAIKEAETKFGEQGAKDLNTRMLTLESRDILKAMGGDREAVTKLEKAVEKSPYNHKASISKITEFKESYTNDYDKRTYYGIEKGREEEKTMTNSEITRILNKLLANLDKLLEVARLLGRSYTFLNGLILDAIERLERGRGLTFAQRRMIARLT